jgi:hypothetical protein
MRKTCFSLFGTFVEKAYIAVRRRPPSQFKQVAEKMALAPPRRAVLRAIYAYKWTTTDNPFAGAEFRALVVDSGDGGGGGGGERLPTRREFANGKAVEFFVWRVVRLYAFVDAVADEAMDALCASINGNRHADALTTLIDAHPAKSDSAFTALVAYVLLFYYAKLLHFSLVACRRREERLPPPMPPPSSSSSVLLSPLETAAIVDVPPSSSSLTPAAPDPETTMRPLTLPSPSAPPQSPPPSARVVAVPRPVSPAYEQRIRDTVKAWLSEGAGSGSGDVESLAEEVDAYVASLSMFAAARDALSDVAPTAQRESRAQMVAWRRRLLAEFVALSERIDLILAMSSSSPSPRTALVAQRRRLRDAIDAVFVRAQPLPPNTRRLA